MATKKATPRRNTKSSTKSKETSSTNAAVEKVALTTKKKGSLKQTSIFILSGVTAVILLALFSYNPADPGLFHHDSNAVIQNKAGSAGAYLADVLFGFFGYLSYLVPIAFLVSAFLLFRSSNDKNNGINLGISVFGVFLALIAGCGLAILLWPATNLAYGAGGLLGQGIARLFMRTLGDIGATMILFSGFIAGVTLFADIQWLKLIDKIGDTILSTIELFTSSSPNKESYETGTIPMSFEANNQPEQSSNNNKNGESASIAGAIGAGLSGLFLWKKSTADSDSGVGFNHPRLDPLDDMTDVAEAEPTKPKKSKKNLLDKALGKVKKQRQEPVLGVPDYMTNNDDYHAEDLPVAGLDDVITAKQAAPAEKKMAKHEKTKQKGIESSFEKDGTWDDKG